MCQAYEAERNWLIAYERRTLRERLRRIRDGEETVTDDEAAKLLVEAIMLSED